MTSTLVFFTIISLMASGQAAPTSDNAPHKSLPIHIERAGAGVSVHQPPFDQSVPYEQVASYGSTSYCITDCSHMTAHDQRQYVTNHDKQHQKAAPILDRPIQQYSSKQEKHVLGKIKDMSPAERYQIHLSKTAALGLQSTSGLPMFSHKLTADGISNHPEINNWHAHRIALEKGEIQFKDLPPHFQSTGKAMKLLPPITNRKGRKRTRQEGDDEIRIAKLNQQARKYKDTRLAKSTELGLHRDSLLPTFAQGIKPEEIKNHIFFNEWNQNRELVEKGLLRPDDIPLHLSNPSGRLKFISIKEKRGRKQLDRYAKLTKAERRRIQHSERRAKAIVLGLHQNSATPIFAQKITVEELKRHKDIDSWHHYRSQMQMGKITEQDLPAQFQTYRVNKGFRFQSAAATKKTAVPENTESRMDAIVDQHSGPSQSAAPITSAYLE
jgi:hypothetical protein